jgi:alanine racemase
MINLARVRQNAERIMRQTNKPLIAVIKADGYGLGAPQVADTLAATVREFAYFTLQEASDVGRPGIVLGPPDADASAYAELGLRPSVTSVDEARAFAGIPLALNVDTGMQRFGCIPDAAADILRAGRFVDAWTHAAEPAAATTLHDVCGGRVELLHAAATSLLDSDSAWLDAVRPGLALYTDSVRVTTRLHCVNVTHGEIGYSRFTAPRVGVILAGYSHHLRPGPVLINGRRQVVLEVGMNTSFVSVDERDQAGAEVVLLGDDLGEHALATYFAVRPHEILCRYCAMGMRQYSRALPATPSRDEEATIAASCTTQSCVAAPQQT